MTLDIMHDRALEKVRPTKLTETVNPLFSVKNFISHKSQNT